MNAAHKILIADDDAVVRQMLRLTLEGAGMQIAGEAENGKEALQKFEALQPDIVCLDVEMPEVKGLDVLARIRRQSPNAVVLLISAFATTQNVLSAVRLNADGIIAKPVKREKVLAEIDRAWAKRRQD